MFRMFVKDPKNRPTAAQLLQTPFIIKHREVGRWIVHKNSLSRGFV